MKNYHILNTSSFLLRSIANHVLSFCNLIYIYAAKFHDIYCKFRTARRTYDSIVRNGTVRIIVDLLNKEKNTHTRNKSHHPGKNESLEFFFIFFLANKSNEIIPRKEKNQARDTENKTKLSSWLCSNGSFTVRFESRSQYMRRRSHNVFIYRASTKV